MPLSVAEERGALETLRRALGQEAHNLRRPFVAELPAFFWQQMYNRLQWMGGSVAAVLDEGLARSDAGDAHWIRSLTRPRESGVLDRTIRSSSEAVTACVFLAGASLLAIVDLFSSTIRVVDLDSDEVFSIETGQEGLNCLAVLPGDRIVVAGGNEGRLRAWDAVTCTLVGNMDAEDLGDAILRCACSADGRHVAATASNGVLALWSTESWQRLGTVYAHEGRAAGCAFSPDGRHIATGGGDGAVRLWSVPELRSVAAWDCGDDTVTSCGFSPDGRRIVLGGRGDLLQIRDAQSGQVVHDMGDGCGFIWCCAFSPDGTKVVSASDDMTVRLWDARTGEPLRVMRGHANMVLWCCFSPDGQRIASGSVDNTVKLWRPNASDVVRDSVGHESSVLDCEFSPDGLRLASAGKDGTVRVWSTMPLEERTVLRGHSGGVGGVAFSPDGARLVSAGWDGTLRLWEPDGSASGDVVARSGSALHTCVWLADGSRVLAGDRSGGLHVWDSADWSPQVAEVECGEDNAITHIAATSDGRRVAAACWDGTARVWDVRTGEVEAVCRGHEGRAYGCCFSPDGTLLATGASDQTVRLWESRSGKQIASARQAGAYVLACEFSPDGRVLATAANDGSFCLLGIPDLRPVLAAVLPNTVANLSWHPTDSVVACAELSGELQLLGVSKLAERGGIDHREPGYACRHCGQGVSQSDIWCPGCGRDL